MDAVGLVRLGHGHLGVHLGMADLLKEEDTLLGARPLVPADHVVHGLGLVEDGELQGLGGRDVARQGLDVGDGLGAVCIDNGAVVVQEPTLVVQTGQGVARELIGSRDVGRRWGVGVAPEGLGIGQDHLTVSLVLVVVHDVGDLLRQVEAVEGSRIGGHLEGGARRIEVQDRLAAVMGNLDVLARGVRVDQVLEGQGLQAR